MGACLFVCAHIIYTYMEMKCEKKKKNIYPIAQELQCVLIYSRSNVSSQL